MHISMTRLLTSKLKLAIISPPWPLFDRPSIQLGTLKAYLKKQFPALDVTAHHAYLAVADALGYDLYRYITSRTLLAEPIYAGLLFPERFDDIEKVFFKQSRAQQKPTAQPHDLKRLAKKVKQTSDAYIDAIAWDRYLLAGFSLCLSQLTAGLYFIRKIKRRYPRLPIIVGGSIVPSGAISNVLKLFPEIDAVVCGEGERPLGGLARHLIAGGSMESLPAVQGLGTRRSLSEKNPIGFSQITDLNELPQPDFGDYFALKNSLPSGNLFYPTLPLELSRGCWWRRKRVGSASHAGCAFCNLNLQWEGYRVKKPGKVVAEIDALTTKHETLKLALTDNVIPAAHSRPFFKQLAGLKKDFKFFCEIRANTPLSHLKEMRNASARVTVQIGIEALSTRLLAKLNKGTTTIQNIEIMKHCEALGIENRSNLILQFPGSDEKDVAETLNAIEFVTPFRPLKPVQFWLGMESPVWQNPRKFGLKARYNHPEFAALFPPEISAQLPMMNQSYRGDRVRQRKLWQAVRAALISWEKTYSELHRKPASEPILSYLDGTDYLIIRQRKCSGSPYIHHIKGTSRAIYLYCAQARSLRAICAKFPVFSEKQIVSFLKMLVDKRLMFEEENSFLSLAIPLR
jgi:ribosomal peptide maturation radical SAM protein 1